ncbi:MAG: HYR domain-containing protein [Candidatus Adlerbacteria bacterium]|nr:HYR domain-containing protein [Candidatus Adlerbacteria bacterium]
MKRTLITGLVLGSALIAPSVAFGAITITDVSFEGGASTIFVDPGESFEANVYATLTEFSKWKGTQWGIHKTTVTTPYCFNSKNDKDRNDNNPNDGPFTQPITVTAPAQSGLYHLSVVGDEKNKCGNPLGPVFTKMYSVWVGQDTGAPVISPHSDMAFDITSGSGVLVDYTNPTATDDFDSVVTVTCTPPSGSFFPVGHTVVTCTATDSTGNEAIPVTFTVSVLLLDTTPPVIESHEDVEATTTDGAGTQVTYTPPTATDDTDGSVAVECVPASGSLFPLGTTAVTCTAQDTAGNEATPVEFVVTVTFVPTPFVMASQPDDSTLCAPVWRDCYTGGSAELTIDLGSGSGLGEGTILNVTIAKDENSPFVSNPWLISILCYTDSAHTITCPDWIQPNVHNSSQTHIIVEQATSTTDNKYWTAYFTDPSKESNFDGSHPVEFNPAYYYDLVINDNGWDIGAYGSASEPYWVLTGMTTP